MTTHSFTIGAGSPNSLRTAMSSGGRSQITSLMQQLLFDRCGAPTYRMVMRPAFQICSHGAVRSGSVGQPHPGHLAASDVEPEVPPAMQVWAVAYQGEGTCGAVLHCNASPTLLRCCRDVSRLGESQSPGTLAAEFR